MVKKLPEMQETQGRSLVWDDPLGGGHGNPLPYSCLENPMDRGAWRATIHRVAKSQTQQATECSRAHTYTRTHIHPHTHTPAHTIGLHRVIASLVIHTGHFGDEEGSSPGQCVNAQNNAQHRVRLIIIIIKVPSFIPHETRNTS